MRILETISERLNRGMEYFVFLSGLLMALTVAVQVFSRYVLNSSLFWSEELARYLLVWISFIGATVAYAGGHHPGIDAVYRRLPQQARRWTRLAVHGVCIALFIIMIVSGSRFAWFVRLQITPALGIPKWIVMSVIPFSGTVFFVHAVKNICQELSNGEGRL